MILTGVTLAMHYTPHIDLAFSSVEHIMRDVNNGWLIRLMHANGASIFFILVYIHIGRGLYFGSYRSRNLLWVSGVTIFIIMMATAFLGYVLPWGQMSFWGVVPKMDELFINSDTFYNVLPFIKLRANKRIGPHNIDIISIIIGSLLGDGYLEKHGNGYRLCFQQEYSNKEYINYLHNYLSIRGYTHPKPLDIKSRIGNKGKIRYLCRFKTWTYSNLKIYHIHFYNNLIKIIPNYNFIYNHLTPLALAIWIMDDGCRSGQGLKLSTNSFNYEDNLKLYNILKDKYNLNISIHKTGHINQYNLYIHKKSIPLLYQLVQNYIHPSMKYKFAI